MNCLSDIDESTVQVLKEKSKILDDKIQKKDEEINIAKDINIELNKKLVDCTKDIQSIYKDKNMDSNKLKKCENDLENFKTKESFLNHRIDELNRQ